jgi:hypothetical protein
MRCRKITGDRLNERMVFRGKKRACVRFEVYPSRKNLPHTSAYANIEPSAHGGQEGDRPPDSEDQAFHIKEAPTWLVVPDYKALNAF